MLFNSQHFLVFFPLVAVLFFVLPHRLRWLWLLVTSYYFYMSWSPSYALLILTSTLITFLSGRFIYRVSKSNRTTAEKKRRKNLWVAISFISNLAILVFFKYFHFIEDSIVQLSQIIGVTWAKSEFNILLPVGISFYTFQALSYTMDVYREKIEPERHFGIYALFVSFFPQLVAGPIERSSHLLPQFKEIKKFDYDRIKSGLLLMLWGFFQKLVIADRLAILVNHVYNQPDGFEGFQLGLATFFFAFQIYCDFSGYSDIAIGAARILGYDLMKNFDRPYFSKSVKEFWRRWHISLSTWFRDYLYYPLGGSKGGKARTYLNILIVFLVSGLWHGANWTFVVWGALHGLYLVIETALTPLTNKLNAHYNINKALFSYRLIKVITTFLFVSFAWIFFRANTVSEAMQIVGKLFTFNPGALFGDRLFSLGMDPKDFYLSLIALMILLMAHMIQRNHNTYAWLQKQWIPIRWGVYLGILLVIVIFGIYGDKEQAAFIYFQF